jgi:hypothetical protein
MEAGCFYALKPGPFSWPGYCGDVLDLASTLPLMDRFGVAANPSHVAFKVGGDFVVGQETAESHDVLVDACGVVLDLSNGGDQVLAARHVGNSLVGWFQ